VNGSCASAGRADVAALVMRQPATRGIERLRFDDGSFTYSDLSGNQKA
jgi:hypothetical protein